MVSLSFAAIGLHDFILAIITAIAVYLVLIVAFFLEERGYPSWFARKLIHISTGSIIGMTLVIYDSLSGPLLAILLFLIPMLLGRLFYGRPVWNLVRIASRRQEESNQWQTLAAGFLAIVSYGIVFLAFPDNPAVFTTSILAVSWGDGAGELVGRPFGTLTYQILGNERTILGSLAVLLFTVIAAIFSFHAFSPLSVITLLPLFLIVGIVVMLLEAISISWLDNFLIPLGAAGVLFVFLM